MYNTFGIKITSPPSQYDPVLGKSKITTRDKVLNPLHSLCATENCSLVPGAPTGAMIHDLVHKHPVMVHREVGI